MVKNKLNNTMKIPNKLWNRLNEVMQEVTVGTWDNVILALILFVGAVCISILLTGFTNPSISPNFILWVLVAFMVILFFTQTVLVFLDSIFFKESRFTNKSKFIALLLSLVLFLILVIVLPFLLLKIIPYDSFNKWYISFPLIVVVYGIPIFAFFCFYSKTKRFFLRNCPNLILGGILKIKDRQRKEEVLKHWKITLPELKKLAKDY